MTRRAKLVCVLAISFLVAAVARTEQTRFWKQTSYSEFEKGTAKGVAIRSDGKLGPAPKFDSFADPNLAYIWALRLDSHGRLYAAGGSNAKVLRFDDSGKPGTVFESSDLAAQAIAFDSADNLYVGTSPDGKVYRVTPSGEKKVFFDPKTKYIWALALDSKGALFVATGDTGQVFVVTPDGNGKLFYQSHERHARSLAFDSKGNLLIGTEPDGLVLRVEITHKSGSATPEAGTSFVLCETDKSEITSLVQDKDGNIYAASVGDKEHPNPLPRFLPGAVPQPQPSLSISSQPGVILQAQAPAPQPTAPLLSPSVTTAGGAEVVKIAPDGSPETLWTSREDLVFALGFSASEKLLLGTGNMGNLIELEGNELYSSVASTASSQVTSFISGTGGKIYVATANPGKIFALGPGYQTSGTFESDTFDAKIFSRWGRLMWWGENGAMQGKVAFYVRSGNTSSPEDNWSPWAGPYKDSGSDPVGCPPARFVQWKAVFLNGSAGEGGIPSVDWVSLAYLPKNVAPVIDDIEIQDPGIRAVGFPIQQGAPGNSPVPLRMPRAAGGSSAPPVMSAEGQNARVETPPQGFEEKGYQSVLWSAHDDNDDDLTFTIYYRGEGEQNWRLLKDKLAQHYYSWDTSTMPDGAYYLKILASDSPSNPGDQALWSERTSERWVVANTPPRIDNLRAGSGVLNTKASFDATSAFGPIAHARYSLDGGDWQIIFPTGSLSDAPKESYYMELPGLPVGEHTLAVQVADSFGNTTTAKVTFTVSPHNQ